MGGIDTVLIDVGGVLFLDPWDSLILPPRTGLAQASGADMAAVKAAEAALRRRYCVRPESEAVFWWDLSFHLGVCIPDVGVEAVDAAARWANPAAAAIIEAAGSCGRRVGLISETTSFWHEGQAAALAAAGPFDPGLTLLSFEHGRSKADAAGSLLEVAAARSAPARTLLIDDCVACLDRASAMGFRTLRHAWDSTSSSAALLSILRSYGRAGRR